MTLVREVRIPRTAAGLVAGAALGAAGVLIQAVTRNPLGDPGLLGVNSGSGFAVTLGVTLTGTTGVTGTVWSAFAGAADATAGRGERGGTAVRAAARKGEFCGCAVDNRP
ncbi:iron chelate uptake ABC transporter family permease subunit [Streptomyces sp. MMS24-I29]|uniref:iron chelate uptake ABC transporter family permease subunit n=1 Tax=Streptomyces sp. MMS24-I29 TaxID=3351480 RepID=UPI003C7A447E